MHKREWLKNAVEMHSQVSCFAKNEVTQVSIQKTSIIGKSILYEVVSVEIAAATDTVKKMSVRPTCLQNK